MSGKVSGFKFVTAGILIAGSVLGLSACQNSQTTSTETKAAVPPAPAPETQAAMPPGHEDMIAQMAKMPKDDAHAMLGNMMGGMPGDVAQQEKPAISWTTPQGWKELPATSMRLGNFLIEGTDGNKAEVSVISLSGVAGGDLANVNRWRGQIQLGPVTEVELAGMSEMISAPAGAMKIFDFASSNPLIGGKYKSRIVAASLPMKDATWFFKMTGEDSVVGSAKPAFKEFIKSVKIGAN